MGQGRRHAPVSASRPTNLRGGSTGKGFDSMAMPTFTMRQLLEAGVHFRPPNRRSRTKIARYILGARNGIHIIDLEQTVPNLHRALQAVRDVAASGGGGVFVGPKRRGRGGGPGAR